MEITDKTAVRSTDLVTSTTSHHHTVGLKQAYKILINLAFLRMEVGACSDGCAIACGLSC